MAAPPALQTAARPAALVLWATAGPAVGGPLIFLLLLPHAEALRAGGPLLALALLVVGGLACGLAVVPTHLLSLVSGWSLGLPLGLAVTLAATTAAAALGHAAGRSLAGPAPLAWAQRHPRGAALCAAIAEAPPGRAGLLVGLLRLSPVVPYAVTNVLTAVFGVRRLPLLAGTAAGLAPRVAVVVALGAGLEQLSWERPDAPWLVAAGVAATVASVAGLGWVTRRALGRLAPLRGGSSAADEVGRAGLMGREPDTVGEVQSESR